MANTKNVCSSTALATVDAAIKAPDGEARHARDRYLRLRAMEPRQLAEFLNSL